jgi:hypothetical protein
MNVKNNDLKKPLNSNEDAISISSEATTTTTTTTTSSSSSSINKNKTTTKKKEIEIKTPKIRKTSSNIQKFNRYFQTKLTLNESIINVFSCALQRNDNHLLIHGTLYVTCKYYAFYSNLFGYQTKFQGKWYDVRDIKKENIALVFPTAIKIELETHEKIIFASFMTRNQAFECIINVWRMAKQFKKAKTEAKFIKLVNIDENNNETTNVRRRHNKQQQQQQSISTSSSSSSLCFDKSQVVRVAELSDTSSLTSSMSSIEANNTIDSPAVVMLHDDNDDKKRKRRVFDKLKFFLSFFLTIIVHNSLNLKSKVLTISTSVSSISTDCSQQQQQQQQIVVLKRATSSFNNLAIILIFIIILSILYLYVFIILTQINHIEEKLINLYKKLNF